ncbi:hypothetical protein ILYODFUR_009566 [Ilyodon furcidens]|uniref:Uncharacterized protein n=1 Tax=Ilyodon furcidens TaxID=33524 RepID=A0ABV0V5A8_9TELE
MAEKMTGTLSNSPGLLSPELCEQPVSLIIFCGSLSSRKMPRTVCWATVKSAVSPVIGLFETTWKHQE